MLEARRAHRPRCGGGVLGGFLQGRRSEAQVSSGGTWGRKTRPDTRAAAGAKNNRAAATPTEPRARPTLASRAPSGSALRTPQRGGHEDTTPASVPGSPRLPRAEPGHVFLRVTTEARGSPWAVCHATPGATPLSHTPRPPRNLTPRLSPPELGAAPYRLPLTHGGPPSRLQSPWLGIRPLGPRCPADGSCRSVVDNTPPTAAPAAAATANHPPGARGPSPVPQPRTRNSCLSGQPQQRPGGRSPLGFPAGSDPFHILEPVPLRSLGSRTALCNWLPGCWGRR